MLEEGRRREKNGASFIVLRDKGCNPSLEARPYRAEHKWVLPTVQQLEKRADQSEGRRGKERGPVTVCSGVCLLGGEAAEDGGCICAPNDKASQTWLLSNPHSPTTKVYRKI